MSGRGPKLQVCLNDCAVVAHAATGRDGIVSVLPTPQPCQMWLKDVEGCGSALEKLVSNATLKARNEFDACGARMASLDPKKVLGRLCGLSKRVFA